MCYRPAAAAKASKCPNCGALNPPIAKTCLKCKTDLTVTKTEPEKEDKENPE